MRMTISRQMQRAGDAYPPTRATVIMSLVVMMVLAMIVIMVVVVVIVVMRMPMIMIMFVMIVRMGMFFLYMNFAHGDLLPFTWLRFARRDQTEKALLLLMNYLQSRLRDHRLGNIDHRIDINQRQITA